MTRLTVGLVQHACGDDPLENRRRSNDGIRAARDRGAELVVLPELHRTRYFCQAEEPAGFDLAEPIPGPSTEHFGALARALDCVLVVSLFERRATGLYHNTAVVLERDGAIAGTYRKTHIPDDPGFYEKFYFTPGDGDLRPIATSVGSLGVMVCWDQWYPEAARLMALAGAEILIYPTAIGWDMGDTAAERARQLEAWTTVQRGHAVANGLPVVAVNRCGDEPGPAGAAGIRFWGHSFVAGCQGDLLAAAGEEATVLAASWERDRTESVRRIWPFLRDRRIDLYGELTRRYRD